MATAKKKCKICGCEYDYCRTNRRDVSQNRWQDVACSPEHAALYFAKIAASRTPAPINEVHEKEDIDMDIVEEDVVMEELDNSNDEMSDEEFEDEVD